MEDEKLSKILINSSLWILAKRCEVVELNFTSVRVHCEYDKLKKGSHLIFSVALNDL